MHPKRSTVRTTALALTCATLAACGGGGDSNTGPAPGGAGAGAGTTVSAAPLTVTGATPATLNGTLDKAAGQFEANSSNDTLTTFNGVDDHCRVGAYALRNSGDNTLYYIEISFRKDTRAVGLLKFGADAGLAVLARSAGPLANVTVDTVNRRIGFNSVTLSSTGTTVTLNGSLEYPTNIAPENRTACG